MKIFESVGFKLKEIIISVSCTIANFFGLNVDLTRAIAMGHDLGHSPFGHEGEKAITEIGKKLGLNEFWHEKIVLEL